MELWVQVFQFDAYIGSGKVPVNFDGFVVALLLPGSDFSLECGLVWDAAIEHLATKDAEFDFGHVKPAQITGRCGS